MHFQVLGRCSGTGLKSSNLDCCSGSPSALSVIAEVGRKGYIKSMKNVEPLIGGSLCLPGDASSSLQWLFPKEVTTEKARETSQYSLALEDNVPEPGVCQGPSTLTAGASVR